MFVIVRDYGDGFWERPQMVKGNTKTFISNVFRILLNKDFSYFR